MSIKNDSIRLKLEKARTLFAEVDVLMQHQFYLTAINRLYYSCYHATRALLLTQDLVPKTHSGVVTLLHKHFVQEGKFDLVHASFFSRLMQERIDDDYSDLVAASEEEVSSFIAPAAKYLSYVECMVIEYLGEN